MKFKFIGNPARPDDKSSISLFGYSFQGGVPVDVTNAHAIAKLSGHSHFAKVADDDESVITVVADKFVVTHPADAQADPEPAPISIAAAEASAAPAAVETSTPSTDTIKIRKAGSKRNQ
jgi:hypothetical protein